MDLLKQIDSLQKKAIYHLFEKKIAKKKKRVEKHHNRSMDEEELKQYKFRLFVVYSFIGVVLIIFLMSLW